MKFKRIFILGIITLCFTICIKHSRAQEKPISDFFPQIIELASNGPADGYFFMGSKGLTATGASHYITIIDNFGTPVFFRKMNKATSSLRLLNDGRIAYLHGVPRKLYFLNEMLEIMDVISVQGFSPNGHDLDISDSGNIILMGQATRIVDMSQIVNGGNATAEVLDLIVQEFDKNLNLLYTWNSADHFEITDANENSPYVDFLENQVDYIHTNGISIDSDTSFLISNRHIEEISKIDRRTGEIIWRLGGKKNQFQFINDDLGFSHQHSIRALDNGNVLLFDNGNLHLPQVSSAVEYAIDEENKTATLVKRIYRSPAVYSNHQGTTQRVHNGNTIINWGPYWPSFTEFGDDGTAALEWDFTLHSLCPRIEKYKWQTKVFETNLDAIDFGFWETDSLKQNIWLKNNSENELSITTVETHSNYFGISNTMPFLIASGDSVEINVWFNPNVSETGYITDLITIASDSETQRIARQLKVTGKKNDVVSPISELVTPGSEISLKSQIQIQFSEPVKSLEGYELDSKLIDQFVIFKETNSEGANVPANVVISTNKKLITIIPDSDLKKASNYYVSVGDGLSDYSGNNLVHFETTLTTVISKSNLWVEDEDNFKIYPNPATSQINVQVFNNKNGFIFTLYNTLGNTVLNSKIESGKEFATFNISDFNNGMYFFVAELDGKRLTKKILKH